MGKEGLCLNLKDPRGLEMMHKLVETADVFVENYRPGALNKLGLGYADLSKLNPGLVYCSVSAYGHSGPRPCENAIQFSFIAWLVACFTHS
jgi:crotonobetainyl-CoA:carnitine CoA-transferase CaiB-like acyl-CoA transferase